MRRSTATAAIALTASLLTLGACTTISDQPEAGDTDTAQIDAHESGPASTIAYGLSVPDGAVQLGPLVRYRSPELIAAYQPELAAVQAENAIEEQQDDDTPTTPTTSPTVDTKPEADAFADLDDPPRPDTYVSLMRVDGQPTVVVRRMLAQLSVLLPDADIVTDDLGAYCTATDRRVNGCRLDVESTTPGGRPLHVVLTVDPGNVATRTGYAATQQRPVMTLTIAYVGDPRAGQEDREPERLADPPSITRSEVTDWIWPRMDEDAPATDPVIDGFVPPTSATVLLSGRRAEFATMTTLRGSIATEIAENFTADRVPADGVSSDVIADLNEVITTTWGTGKDGATIRTVHTLSARGNYLALFVTPPTAG